MKFNVYVYTKLEIRKIENDHGNQGKVREYFSEN